MLEKPFALAKFARKRRALPSAPGPWPSACPVEGAKRWRAEPCLWTRCEAESYLFELLFLFTLFPERTCRTLQHLHVEVFEKPPY